ncbi:MAG: NAD(P) transhydrogenase subunit alpha [Planctomycetes bacterium RBG_16_43_13]|nr:MAG: NAD(P) transhydrogenase subunit alpha [Planctomycetes bacterium RBG_16_43_13]
MIVAIPKEITSGEHRVTLVPESVVQIKAAGADVVVESNAGQPATFSDNNYQDKGAVIEPNHADLLKKADVILKVQCPTDCPGSGHHEAELMKEGSILIALLRPFANLNIMKRLAERKVTAFAMELMPRITRAQTMDALSSMSTIAGYKAVLVAASASNKFFPMLMTAAGMIAPAKVFIIGAGVAGLQAIATARRLGAVVEAYDMRPVVKEQVQSLGAKFVELPIETKDAQDAGGYAKQQTEEFYKKQQEMMAKHIKQSDVVITTALVPGKRAPVLITEEMVKGMRPGSVIVDLAAEEGGNCALTEPGKEVVKYGVIINGFLNLPSSMALPASQMYSRNITNFFLHLYKDGKLNIDLNDELTRGPLVTHNGEIVNEAIKTAITSGGIK